MRRGNRNNPPQSSGRGAIPISDLGIALGLACLVVLIYSQTAGFEFINFDDDLYVYSNPTVQEGLSPANFLKILTGIDPYYWHPLSMLSHALDWEWHGGDAGGHHLTNVALHMAASVLLYLSLKRLTGAVWRSAVVAALFATHPLHVESVAWVSERKDVLCAAFWFLTLWAYASYSERRTPGRYFAVVLCFAGALMAKPMAVTLPLVLLLLDYWPLRRWGNTRVSRLAGEKIPLIVLAVADSIVTYRSQAHYGSDELLRDLPLGLRAANAVVAYGIYLVKTVWPHAMSIIYPYRRDIPQWEIFFSTVLVVGITAIAVGYWKRFPYMVTGWFWFLGALVPTIGLIQVGYQPNADRFVYLPHVGLFVVVVWGLADLARRWRVSGGALAAVTAGALSLLTATAFVETGYWRDGVTLFQHSVDVTRKNYVAHTLLGYAFQTRGRLADARIQFAEAVRIDPGYGPAHNDLGSVLAQQGQLGQATEHFAAAVRLMPDFGPAHYNLAMALMKSGHGEGALGEFDAALRCKLPDPYRLSAMSNAGAVLINAGRSREGAGYLEKALRINPADSSARKNLAYALYNQGRIEDAIEQLATALRYNPGDTDGAEKLAEMRRRAGHVPERQ
jgi:Flp pilus assembly protein TadD